MLLTGETKTAQIPVQAQQIFALEGAQCELIPALAGGRLTLTARLTAQARALFGGQEGTQQALERLLTETMDQCRQCGVDALGLQALLQREYPRSGSRWKSSGGRRLQPCRRPPRWNFCGGEGDAAFQAAV